MDVYYFVVLFIFGTIFGSFYNVVGWRLPRGESIITPSSHCTKCNHKLTPIELIPILSYLSQGRKCKNCHVRISPFYAIFEFLTGLLFGISYLIFGLSIDLLLALTFISMLLIVIISDYQTMIIPDEVLLFFGFAIIIELFMKGGLDKTLNMLLNGIISFIVMYLIKKMGDIIFKRESMGGGDIKLMFVFGLYFGTWNAILSIFIASFIGLPIAIICLKKLENHEIPFGPFLAIAAMIITLTPIDFNTLTNFLVNL